jgi:hypothetical protein
MRPVSQKSRAIIELSMDKPMPKYLLPNAVFPQNVLLYPNPVMSLSASLIRPLSDCIHVDSEVYLLIILLVYRKVSIDEIMSRAFQSQ